MQQVDINEPPRKNQRGGGAAMVAATTIVLGSAALLGGTSDSEAAFSMANDAKVFEMRSTPAVMPADEPLPTELRRTSPLPYAGDDLAAPPAVKPAEDVPPPERRVLTSFASGGPSIVTGGEAEIAAKAEPPIVSSAEPLREAQRPFNPPPVVWNNPLQWISVHQYGL